MVENPADVLLTVMGGLGVAKDVAEARGLTTLASNIEKAQNVVNPVNILKKEAQIVGKVGGKIGNAITGSVEGATSLGTGISREAQQLIKSAPSTYQKATTGEIGSNTLLDEVKNAIDTRADDLAETGREYESVRKGLEVADKSELEVLS